MTKDVVTDANIITIPPEVVEKSLSALSVGVYGVDADSNLAVPTIWADLGFVRESANPSGDTTTDTSLPVWAQILAMIGDLDDLETTARDNLVAAVNEAMTKGGGDVNEEEIRRIVDAYLTANPPDPGEPGKSAYELAVANGFAGSEADWLESLRGKDGQDGTDGHTPVYGVDYGTPEQISGIAQSAAEILRPDVNQLKDDLANKEPLHKVLSATLVTGETTLIFTDDAITDSAIIYIYTDIWGVQPSAVVQSDNTLTLTFDAQSADLGVKVEVR